MIKDSEEVKAAFTLAGIPALKIKPLVDGYSYHPDDSRFYETPPRCAWWFVKTDFGWVEIGPRKHVYAIDWSDTIVREVITVDNVTKSETGVHAHSIEKVVEYLRSLKGAADKHLSRVVEMLSEYGRSAQPPMTSEGILRKLTQHSSAVEPK